MVEDFLAQVVHGFLADVLHDADLHVLCKEIEKEDEQVNQADDDQAVAGGGEGDCVADSWMR